MNDYYAEADTISHTSDDPKPGFDSRPPFHYVYAAEEDRCAVRYPVAIPSRLRFSCSQSFDVILSDISLAGFNCDALMQVEPGTRCWITMQGLGSLEAEVIRHDNRGLGCAFSVLLNPAVLDRLIAEFSTERPQGS